MLLLLAINSINGNEIDGLLWGDPIFYSQLHNELGWGSKGYAVLAVVNGNYTFSLA
jgi:hypothetical protein